MQIADLTQLPDPCPLPSTDKKQRKLDERSKLLYAPMSDVGGLLYDKGAKNCVSHIPTLFYL